MIKLGYDGTMYENVAERGGVSYSFTSPNQIKHIDNNGNFSTAINNMHEVVIPETGLNSISQQAYQDIFNTPT